MPSNFIHMLEFRTVEGHMLLQRADQIVSILETTLPATKPGAQPRKVIHLMLSNNNRVQVVGETRESMMRRLRDCADIHLVTMQASAEPEPEPEATDG